MYICIFLRSTIVSNGLMYHVNIASRYCSRASLSAWIGVQVFSFSSCLYFHRLSLLSSASISSGITGTRHHEKWGHQGNRLRNAGTSRTNLPFSFLSEPPPQAEVHEILPTSSCGSAKLGLKPPPFRSLPTW